MACVCREPGSGGAIKAVVRNMEEINTMAEVYRI